MIELTHGRVTLALHELQAANGARPLVLLHGLGLRSPKELPDDVTSWSGPVYALDFTGHGDSTTIGEEAPHLDEWIARGH